MAQASAPEPFAWARFDSEIHRIVEGQHYIATRQLVDTQEEHDLLERLLDASKPPAPESNSRGALHYLLFTPFRYPPLRHGGRFHRPFEQSLFYGASQRITAMAEIAYYRFVFMMHSAAVFAPMGVPYTHFTVRAASLRAVLLTEPPYLEQRPAISDPASYAHSQPLGSAMRAAGAEVFTAFSARWPEGFNVGLFTPEALAENTPRFAPDSHWTVFVSSGHVEFSQVSPTQAQHAFSRRDFEIGGVLPLLG